MAKLTRFFTFSKFLKSEIILKSSSFTGVTCVQQDRRAWQQTRAVGQDSRPGQGSMGRTVQQGGAAGKGCLGSRAGQQGRAARQGSKAQDSRKVQTTINNDISELDIKIITRS